MLSLSVLAVLAMSSCTKEKSGGDFVNEISTETESMKLPESGFNITEVEALSL